jgi:ABC-type branched-subunit amino acid transport system permease subunit
MARLAHLLDLLTGPEDIGRSRWFWAAFVAVCIFLFVYPFWLTEFEVTNFAYYLLNVPIALGLGLLWGYCGVLSFGQVAYFGIAGYV